MEVKSLGTVMPKEDWVEVKFHPRNWGGGGGGMGEDHKTINTHTMPYLVHVQSKATV